MYRKFQRSMSKGNKPTDQSRDLVVNNNPHLNYSELEQYPDLFYPGRNVLDLMNRDRERMKELVGIERRLLSLINDFASLCNRICDVFVVVGRGEKLRGYLCSYTMHDKLAGLDDTITNTFADMQRIGLLAPMDTDPEVIRDKQAIAQFLY